MEPKDLERKFEDTIAKLEKRINHLEEELAFAQNEVDRLRNELANEKFSVPTFKHYESPTIAHTTKCFQCGLEMSGPMGYVCGTQPCPMGMGSPLAA